LVSADATTLAVALVVPAACYAAIAAFGWFAREPATPMVDPPISV
jgi:FHS family L-fucose permease-like MFS transporter